MFGIKFCEKDSKIDKYFIGAFGFNNLVSNFRSQIN